jgi:hypothetical protein
MLKRYEINLGLYNEREVNAQPDVLAKLRFNAV